MNIAIVYSSVTGNTEILAEAVKEELKDEKIIYFGKPPEDIPDADVYFVGSWTDKGCASNEITGFISRLEDKKIVFFGTAGYGGSEEYYRTLFSRVKAFISPSNQISGYFYCQGKMPASVKERYIKMLGQDPENENLKASVKNFDDALSHPDEEDIKNLKIWMRSEISAKLKA